LDLNSDGLQNRPHDGYCDDPIIVSEPGVEGVVVNLYDCDTDELVASTVTDSDGYYYFGTSGSLCGDDVSGLTFNEMPRAFYVEFELPDGLAFTTQNVGDDDRDDSDADPVTGQTHCIVLSAGRDGEPPRNTHDVTLDAGLVLACDFCGCRFTGGGLDTDGNWDHTLEYGEMERNGAGNLPSGIDRAQFGGQAGASTGQPPQPKGEWTHHQQRGPSGSFTFHGGTSSAPAGTEIDEIRCSDPGGCKPSGNPPSPAKQLDFDGIGTFKSIGNGGKAPIFDIPNPNVTAEGKGNKDFDGTFHWFEVNIDDLGERGGLNTGAPNSDDCPSTGFGEKGTVDLGNCDCPDFYRITIYNGVNAENVVLLPDGSIDPAPLRAQEVIYEFYGYIDGGNLQIHEPTGYDLQALAEEWLAGQ